MKKEVISIYSLKALGAIFVLLIHFHIYGQHFFAPITRCGVNIFFIIGGYFILYGGNSVKVKAGLLKRMRKLFYMFLLTNTMYCVLRYCLNGQLCIENIHDLYLLLLHGDVVSGHLWFLNAYFWTLVLLYVVKHMGGGNFALYILAFFLWTYSMLVGQYSFLLPNCYLLDVRYVLPLIHLSMPMIVIGIFIRERCLTLSHRQALILFLISVLITYGENRIVSYYDMWNSGTCLGTTIMPISFLLLALSNENWGRGTFIETFGKDHSANIYYWQYVPVVFFGSWISQDFLDHISFLIILPIIVVLSWILNKIYIYSRICR